MSTFNPLLAIMNPRQIPECIESLKRLEIRKVWLSNYTEWELTEVIHNLILSDSHQFSHLCLVADDCIVDQGALNAVMRLAESGEYRAVTGYCRLDFSHPDVNICKRPLSGDRPRVWAYDFYSYDQAANWPDEVIPTHFAGFALTCMARGTWKEFPFGAYGNASLSYASDFHLSRRLRDAGVEIGAARDGYVTHVKERWNKLDRGPGRETLVGKKPAEVRWSE